MVVPPQQDYPALSVTHRGAGLADPFATRSERVTQGGKNYFSQRRSGLSQDTDKFLQMLLVFHITAKVLAVQECEFGNRQRVIANPQNRRDDLLSVEPCVLPLLANVFGLAFEVQRPTGVGHAW